MTRSSYANSLTKSILQWLAVKGIVAWRNQSAAVWDPVKKIHRRNPAIRKGVADILGILPPDGRLLAIEVKSPKDRMSPDQKAFQADVEAAGGVFIQARELDDVIGVIEQQ